MSTYTLPEFDAWSAEAGRKPGQYSGIMSSVGTYSTALNIFWSVGSSRPCTVCGAAFLEAEQAVAYGSQTELQHRPSHVRCFHWAVRGTYGASATLSQRKADRPYTDGQRTKLLLKLRAERRAGRHKRLTLTTFSSLKPAKWLQAVREAELGTLQADEAAA